MARLLTLVLGFTAVVHLHTATVAAKEAIHKPDEDVTLQCTGNKVIVPEYVRYQNSDVKVGEDCVLDKVRVNIIKSCFNKPSCSVHIGLATDCDRGTDDIVVKYECVAGTKLLTACSNTTRVNDDFLPFYWSSPHYPLNYNPQDECTISVNPDSNTTYRLTILDMQLEARSAGVDGCYDKLRLEDEQRLANMYVYCGSITDVKTGEALVKDIQHLKITLTTDAATHKRGVLLKVEDLTATLNECKSEPCLHGATCVDDFETFRCVCRDGYEGSRCEDKTKSTASRPAIATTIMLMVTSTVLSQLSS